jgi:hypothetical protein
MDEDKKGHILASKRFRKRCGVRHFCAHKISSSQLGPNYVEKSSGNATQNNPGVMLLFILTTAIQQAGQAHNCS